MPDLSEIFGQREEPAPQRRETSTGSPPSKTDIHRQAKELEDLLNVARDRDTSQKQAPAPRQPSPAPSTPRQSQPAPVPAGRPSNPPASRPAPGKDDDVLVDSPYAPRGGAQRSQNDEALVLVRAMLNAAKADGRVSSAEQQSILEQVGGSADVTQFVRDELSQPLDVREFAWSVPLGMEEQVYAMSVMAIDVDEQAEQRYLGELAHGLRIPDEVCEQLQQRYRRKPR